MKPPDNLSEQIEPLVIRSLFGRRARGRGMLDESLKLIWLAGYRAAMEDETKAMDPDRYLVRETPIDAA